MVEAFLSAAREARAVRVLVRAVRQALGEGGVKAGGGGDARAGGGGGDSPYGFGLLVLCAGSTVAGLRCADAALERERGGAGHGAAGSHGLVFVRSLARNSLPFTRTMPLHPISQPNLKARVSPVIQERTARIPRSAYPRPGNCSRTHPSSRFRLLLLHLDSRLHPLGDPLRRHLPPWQRCRSRLRTALRRPPKRRARG